MDKAQFNPSVVNTSGKGHYRYNNFDAELKRVREYLSTRIATATMVAVSLDIYRPNLCRHVATLSKQGVLSVVRTGLCKVTSHRANYVTCMSEFLNKPE